MATQKSLIAQQSRIREWAEQIRDCQSRPKGMDVETWCAQNNLTKANYYYRLRRVREVYLEQFRETSPELIEISNPKPQIAEAEKTFIFRQYRCKISDRALGEPHLVHADRNGNNKIYVLTWSDIFDEFSLRHDYLMCKLELEKEIWLKKHDSIENVVEDIKENSATLDSALIPKRAQN